MPASFPDLRTGRPWNYDRGDNEFEYYAGQGASQLEIAVVDHGERPTTSKVQLTARWIQASRCDRSPI
jgi:hypothetical protein